MNTLVPSSRVRLTVGIALAATMSGLAGCGGGPKASVAPPVTPPPATSPNPVPVTPGAAIPSGVVFNPVTNLCYVANGPALTITVMDGATNQMTATIPVERNVNTLAINSTTNTIYALGFGDQSLAVIDGVTNAVSWSDSSAPRVVGWQSIPLPTGFTSPTRAEARPPMCTFSTEPQMGS
jgi:YVTN family beta-propeller protein